MSDKIRHYEITYSTNSKFPVGTRFDAVEHLGMMHQEYLAEGLAKELDMTPKEAKSAFVSIKYEEI